MRRIAAIAWAFLLAGSVQASPARADGAAISVARITSSLQEGQKWGRTATAIGCITNSIDLRWGVGIGKLNVRAFEQPTREELKRANIAIAGDPTDPFADKEANLALGGTITSINSEFCYNSVLFGNTRGMVGSTSLGIDWQLYSNLERKVVARIHTEGQYATKTQTTGGFEEIMIRALNDGVRKLAASAEFRQALSVGGSPPSRPAATAGDATAKSPLILAGAKAVGPAKIPDAVGSVVLILAAGGHGSGFLVSTDGYLMTAEHVVGSDKYVKIRWSDGLEGLGEVIRTDKRRDAAILKVDPRGRRPLALRRDAPQPGDTTFAIGAPIDPKLQSTVTRGVVSANRIIDGFSFIQSDVTVDPGNSGGPLLDEQGRVLGFTDIGYRPKDAPTGLNFFVPIDDALRFLAAEPQ